MAIVQYVCFIILGFITFSLAEDTSSQCAHVDIKMTERNIQEICTDIDTMGQISCGEDEPKSFEFTEVPEDKKKQLNQEVTFKCITEPMPCSTNWYFNDILVKEHNFIYLNDSIPQEITVLAASGPESYGTYKCEVTLYGITKSASATLSAPEKDSACAIEFRIKPTSDSVRMFSMHKFECGANNAENLKLTWYKHLNGKETKITRDSYGYVLHGTGELEITSVQAEHNATFLCEIRDDIPEKACWETAAANLVVIT